MSSLRDNRVKMIRQLTHVLKERGLCNDEHKLSSVAVLRESHSKDAKTRKPPHQSANAESQLSMVCAAHKCVEPTPPQLLLQSRERLLELGKSFETVFKEERARLKEMISDMDKKIANLKKIKVPGWVCCELELQKLKDQKAEIKREKEEVRRRNKQLVSVVQKLNRRAIVMQQRLKSINKQEQQLFDDVEQLKKRNLEVREQERQLETFKEALAQKQHQCRASGAKIQENVERLHSQFGIAKGRLNAEKLQDIVADLDQKLGTMRSRY